MFCRSDTESGKTTFTFRSFPVTELDAAITYCLENHTGVIDTDRSLYSCGVNMGTSEKILCDRLNIKK